MALFVCEAQGFFVGKARSRQGQTPVKHDRSQQQQQDREVTREADVRPAAGLKPKAERGHSYAAGAAIRANHHAGQGDAGTVVSEIDTRASELSTRHGGLIGQQADQAGVPTHSIAAVVLAETSLLNTGTQSADGTLLRFEPYTFFERTGTWLVATHKDQAAEYAAFEQAKAVDEDAALHSVRVGVGQLQGDEARAAGFDGPAEMMDAMRGDEVAQIQALSRVVAQDGNLSGALSSEDWAAVALMRAGPAYGALGYDQALASYASAYQRATGYGGDDDDDGDDKPKRKRSKNSRRPG